MLLRNAVSSKKMPTNDTLPMSRAARIVFLVRLASFFAVCVLVGCIAADEPAAITVEGSAEAIEFRLALESNGISFTEESDGTFLVAAEDFDAAFALIEEKIHKQPLAGDSSGCLRIRSSESTNDKDSNDCGDE